MTDFGEWLSNERNNRKLDLNGAANLTHVSIASLSRIEHGEVEPRYSTVIKICDAFDVDWKTLYVSLNNDPDLAKRIWAQQLIQDYQNEILPSWDGVESFLKLISMGPEEGEEFNRAYKLLGEMAQESFRLQYPTLHIAETIYNLPLLLNADLGIFHLDIIPHPKLDWRYLHLIFRYGGPLLPTDVGAMLQARRKSAKSEIDKSLKSFISSSMISRIENGQVDKLKFGDVLLLDKYLGVDGDIFGMFWLATRLQDLYDDDDRWGISRIVDQKSGTLLVGVNYESLISAFIHISRWLWLQKLDNPKIRSLINSYEQENSRFTR